MSFVTQYAVMSDEHRAKVAKLEGIIKSLKIELQNEREAHTSARDAAAHEDCC